VTLSTVTDSRFGNILERSRYRQRTKICYPTGRTCGQQARVVDSSIINVFDIDVLNKSSSDVALKRACETVLPGRNVGGVCLIGHERRLRVCIQFLLGEGEH